MGKRSEEEEEGWVTWWSMVSLSSFHSTWHKSSSSNYDKVGSLDYVVSPWGREKIIHTNVFYSE